MITPRQQSSTCHSSDLLSAALPAPPGAAPSRTRENINRASKRRGVLIWSFNNERNWNLSCQYCFSWRQLAEGKRFMNHTFCFGFYNWFLSFCCPSHEKRTMADFLRNTKSVVSFKQSHRNLLYVPHAIARMDTSLYVLLWRRTSNFWCWMLQNHTKQ